MAEKRFTDLVCLDIDGTVLSGNLEREARFREWASLRPRRVALAYASGRSVPNIRAEIISGRLPWPEAIIGHLGTVIEYPEGGAEELTRAMFAKVHPEWNHRAAMEAGLGEGIEAQEEDRLNRYKASFYWDGREETLAAFRERVRARFPPGSWRYMAVEGKYIDVLPHCVGKAGAASALAGSLGLRHEDVIVSGDSENDQDLFREPGFRKILPSNAVDLLRGLAPDAYPSPYPDADGVIDGLRHFGLG